MEVKSLSHVLPSATPWTAVHQAPPSMGFSRQEFWSGVPLLRATPHMSENDYKSTATDFGVVYNLDSRLIYKNEIHE